MCIHNLMKVVQMKCSNSKHNIKHPSVIGIYFRDVQIQLSVFHIHPTMNQAYDYLR